jgi:hypothetical protein
LSVAVSHGEEGPLQTTDGEPVVLQANIERSDDVAGALSAGAEGIGLYRSEFMLVGGPPDMAVEYEPSRLLTARERMADGSSPSDLRRGRAPTGGPLVDAALDE